MIQHIAQGAAQAIADGVSHELGAHAKGVAIGTSIGLDGELRYFIWSTEHGHMETVRLLCYATTVARLTALARAFIDSI